MRVAAIDIGTHAVLLLIADTASGVPRPVFERASFTRLGEGVDGNGYLLETACERTLACLKSYADDVCAQGATRLAAVGTSALRDVAGRQAFLTRAAAILGVEVRVIDGTVEGQLTFAGALSGLSLEGRVNVFDIGGGSTEIVAGAATAHTRSISHSVSLDIGSVRLFERHVHSDPPTAQQMRCVERDISLALEGAPKLNGRAPLVGVAGTMTQLAALELGLAQYDGARVHGQTLSLAAVERMALRVRMLSSAQRRALPGMEAARADVITVGSAIARAVLEWAGVSEVIVSDRGVRWGLAAALADEGEAS